MGTVSSQHLLPFPSPEINKIYILKEKIPQKHVILSLLICPLGLQLVPCTRVLEGPGHLEHGPQSRVESGVCGQRTWCHCSLLEHSLPSSMES